MMIDFLSLLWTVFQEWGASSWMISIACVLTVCFYLLIKEYGRIYIAHLLHRRNRLSLCGILLYFCVFLVLFQTGLFMRMPLAFRILTSILYAGYIVAVLCSVQGPILLSRRYLNKYRRWLSLGFAHEHRDFLSKMPWYFLDQSETVNYQQLKGNYLYELGNLRLAYETLSAIDQTLLYPEEIADLTVNLVYMTLELGNFPKAEQLAERVKAADLPTYGFLKSYLAELQGNSDAAWRYACDGENAIHPRQTNARIFTSLYTQLGRLSFFRNNITEGFRYYHLALQQAKQCGDIRLLHPVYQNLILQIQLHHLHEDEAGGLMEEYTAAVSQSSLQNMLEFSNFRVTLARQQRDKEKEYEAILAGYRALHSKTAPPEQYVIEISTLSMLTNGNFDATAVLNDVARHFDAYFTLPLPSRIIVLQGLTRPARLNAEQAVLYEAWTPRLIYYARYQAPRDMDQYERQLSTDCVNERCWLLHQRIDFLRRSDEHYDGRQVLQWLQEMAQIYRDCNQAFHEIETELAILKQCEEMLFLHQLPPDSALFSKMNALLADAYAKAKQLPAVTVGGYWIDLAYFSANLDSACQGNGPGGAGRCNARGNDSQRNGYSDANPKSPRMNKAGRNSGPDSTSRYGARSDASSESISSNNAGQWNGLDGAAQGSISRERALNDADECIGLDGADRCSGQSDASQENISSNNAGQDSSLNGAIERNARSNIAQGNINRDNGLNGANQSDINPEGLNLNNSNWYCGLNSTDRCSGQSDASQENINSNNADQDNILNGANGCINQNDADRRSNQSDTNPEDFNWSNAAQTRDCLNRFLDLQLSPQHLSLNLQQKLSWLLSEFSLN